MVSILQNLKKFKKSKQVSNFAGSPRNKYGTHSSRGFKGNYANAWKIHFSQIGGGALTPAASGAIRGTVRRCEMIAKAMKPPVALIEGDKISARSGGKSPLKGSFPEKPSDYGLTSWRKPGEDDLTAKDITFSKEDLNIIKKAAMGEIKWRIKQREKKEDSITNRKLSPKVCECVRALKRKGMSEQRAIRICQAKFG